MISFHNFEAFGFRIIFSAEGGEPLLNTQNKSLDGIKEPALKRELKNLLTLGLMAAC